MALTSCSHGFPKMTSKAPPHSKTTKCVNELVPPILTFPDHNPAHGIVLLFATLTLSVVGMSVPRQCPYECHMWSPMQFRIAPSSTCAVACTGYCEGPAS